MFKKFVSNVMLRTIKFGASFSDSSESKVAQVIAEGMLNKEELIVLNFKKLEIDINEQKLIVDRLHKLYEIFEHPELSHVAVIRL